MRRRKAILDPAGHSLIAKDLVHNGFEAVQALLTGYTHTHYRSHVYDRRENAGCCLLWVTGPTGLGALAVAAAPML